MRSLHISAAVLCAATLATAQTVTEIPAFTVPNATVDMDLVGFAGPTTLAAINASARPCRGEFSAITLTPSGAAAGIYNSNPQEGLGLGLDAGGNFALIEPPTGAFTAFNAQVDLAAPATEFSLGIGDWLATMDLDFYLGGSLQTSFTTTRFDAANGINKTFQMTGGTFDRVDIRASSTAGNWVITQLGAEVAPAVNEIAAMTVCATQIDPDNIGLGSTSNAAIRAAGSPYAGNCALRLTPSAAAAGVYNFNAGLGNAIALDAAGGLAVIAPPAGAFTAFDASIAFSNPCRQFGLGVGDWGGPMDLDFYFNGNPVLLGYRTTNYSSTSLVKFFDVNCVFDRVDIRASTTAGNWVITELWCQVADERAAIASAFGTGCGSAGAVTTAPINTPRIGTTFRYSISNLNAPTQVFLVIGFSDELDPGLGALPFDLGNVFPNLSGCNVYTSLDVVNGPFAIPTSGATANIPIPNEPSLVGGEFFSQSLQTDRALGIPGVSASSAVAGRIGC